MIHNIRNLTTMILTVALFQVMKNHFLDSFQSLPFFDTCKIFIHSNKSILSQLVIRNLLGCFNQVEQDVLLHDTLLFNDAPVARQPAVFRFFDRVTRLTNVQFKYNEPKQEADSFIHRYQETGYHPLMINEFNLKLLVIAQLGTGKSYSSNGIVISDSEATVLSTVMSLSSIWKE
ncbi:hypothetical protein [uncultured Traorella sp.]|uniref:hypothetical protein n=1 Tax=uncultured Traorella sp. TaxID=1929048 RepID=UPI0025EF20C2|nr:hypothetical protein [uncultured Traorella sp.]